MVNRVKPAEKKEAGQPQKRLTASIVAIMAASEETELHEDTSSALSAAVVPLMMDTDCTPVEAMDKLIEILNSWKEKSYHEDQQG